MRLNKIVIKFIVKKVTKYMKIKIVRSNVEMENKVLVFGHKIQIQIQFVQV